MCAVGYYCCWDTAQSAPAVGANASKGTHYSLHRYFRDSAATLGFFTQTGAGNYVSPITLYSPATVDANGNAVDELLATDVWNLQVTAYNADGTAYNPDSSGATILPVEVNKPPGVAQPAALEISFTAMSSSAARTMTNVSTSANDWMDTSSTNYKNLIAPHAYQFRTRIKLP